MTGCCFNSGLSYSLNPSMTSRPFSTTSVPSSEPSVISSDILLTSPCTVSLVLSSTGFSTILASQQISSVCPVLIITNKSPKLITAIVCTFLYILGTDYHNTSARFPALDLHKNQTLGYCILAGGSKESISAICRLHFLCPGLPRFSLAPSGSSGE